MKDLSARSTSAARANELIEREMTPKIGRKKRFIVRDLSMHRFRKLLGSRLHRVSEGPPRFFLAVLEWKPRTGDPAGSCADFPFFHRKASGHRGGPIKCTPLSSGEGQSKDQPYVIRSQF